MKNLKVKIYSIKDDIAGYGQLWCEHSDEGATRQLEMLVKKEGSLYSLHPEQFNLIRVGEFDTETGEIEVCNEFIDNGAKYGN